VVARQAEDTRCTARERAAEGGVGGGARVVADVAGGEDRVRGGSGGQRGIECQAQRHGRVDAVQLDRWIAEQVRVRQLQQLDSLHRASIIAVRMARVW
jgi:hypothetical protein